MAFLDRLQHGWDAFINNRDPTEYKHYGDSYYRRPDRTRLTRGGDRSITTSVYNRMAIDVASVKIRHVKLDANDRYISDVGSYLNDCFISESNLDQTPSAFFQDVALTMFDKGVVAIVPTKTTLDPKRTTSYDIQAMRAGEITQWYPEHVKVKLYNDRTGRKEEITLPKKVVAIVSNPFYTVMNEPNSTMQRLIKKLALLDDLDAQNCSGKLDLIIQLPYVVKSELRRQEAEKRRKDIEMQLTGSKYGVAYTDGTERITQLNRPLENNLWKQIDDLKSMLYSQLGITAEIMNGTADAKTMLNYMNRTIEPIVKAIVEEMNRKFLTKTARTQGQAIRSFTDPFNLIPVDQLTELVGTFTSCAVLTPNEVRQIIGMKPADDPGSDQLVNRNINQMPGEDPYAMNEEEMLMDGEEPTMTTPEGYAEESDVAPVAEAVPADNYDSMVALGQSAVFDVLSKLQ